MEIKCLPHWISGYCIANLASKIGWDDINISDNVEMDSFIGGLKTNNPCGGFIDNLILNRARDTRYPLHELFSLIDVRGLELFAFDSNDLIHILELIPLHLNNLRIYNYYLSPCVGKCTSPSTLLINTDEPLSDDCFGALKKLIHTGRFKKSFT